MFEHVIYLLLLLSGVLSEGMLLAAFRLVQLGLTGLLDLTWAGFTAAIIMVVIICDTVCFVILIMLCVVGFSDTKVEPLNPPDSCKPGDRVFVAGFEQISCGRK